MAHQSIIVSTTLERSRRMDYLRHYTLVLATSMFLDLWSDDEDTWRSTTSWRLTLGLLNNVIIVKEHYWLWCSAAVQRAAALSQITATTTCRWARFMYMLKDHDKMKDMAKSIMFSEEAWFIHSGWLPLWLQWGPQLQPASHHTMTHKITGSGSKSFCGMTAIILLVNVFNREACSKALRQKEWACTDLVVP